MASSFETQQRVLRQGGAQSSQPPEAVGASYQEAMELINTGLKLDHTSPLQAIEYYQKGGDALSGVIDAMPTEGFGAVSGLGDVTADKMQRTLDMVEERVRCITRLMLDRQMTDSQSTTASPIGTPMGSLDSPTEGEADELEFVASQVPPAFNIFDFGEEQSLSREVRISLHSFGNSFLELRRVFGFQEESVRNQQEHLVTLLANTSSRPTLGGAADADAIPGLTVLHRKLFSNYRSWIEQLQVHSACAGDGDVLHNKVTPLPLHPPRTPPMAAPS